MIVQEEEGHASGSDTFVVPLRVEAQIVCEPICWGLEAKAFLFALQCQEQIPYDCRHLQIDLMQQGVGPLFLILEVHHH